MNTGYKWQQPNYFYNERLIEQPFLFNYLRRPPLNVIDIGCAESMNPIQLAMLGYDVIGIDMQDYGWKHPNFEFIKADFLDYNIADASFGAAVNISAIEHFGLLAYANMKEGPEADRKAVKKVYDILKPKGQFIFTAPYGKHDIIGNFERIYDKRDLKYLLNGFSVRNKIFYDVQQKSIVRINEEEADEIEHNDLRYAVVCLDLQKKESLDD